MMSMRSLADSGKAPRAVAVTGSHRHRHRPGPQTSGRHDERGMGDFQPATSGDLDLATPGDILMATYRDAYERGNVTPRRVRRAKLGTARRRGVARCAAGSRTDNHAADTTGVQGTPATLSSCSQYSFGEGQVPPRQRVLDNRRHAATLAEPAGPGWLRRLASRMSMLAGLVGVAHHS